MSHTDLDEEIEARQKLEEELEQLRADMALLEAENMTYKQYGSCHDCGFPLDKTADDDIVCHKCGEEIGDRIIAQLRADLQAAQERIAEQARQLDAARDTMIAVMPHLPINGDGYNMRHPSRISIDAWLAANPAPEAEAQP